MNISVLAVRRPITTLMCFLTVVLLGIVSYFRLPVQLLPDIDFPTIGVFAYSEKSTQENLDSITREVEAIVADMPNVRRVSSSTRPTNVWIRVSLEYDTDVQLTVVDLEERLVSFRRKLTDRRTTIQAFPFSTSDFQANFMFLSVRGEGDVDTLFRTAAEKVEQQLKSINGVSGVELRGATVDSVRVNLDPDLMSAYKLNFGQVIARVQAAVAENTFLGEIKPITGRIYARLQDKVSTVDQLADLFVDGKGVFRLRDVSRIEQGAAVDKWVNRSDGKNSIGISLQREAGRNIVELAQVARERVKEINTTLPSGVELIIEEDFAKYVEDAVGQVQTLAAGGALLALFVPMIFFRSLRMSLIVFSAIPICLISVFNLFLAAGMSLNIFSIVGLAIGVGMLVDNSIVVTENAFRLARLGASPLEAAEQGGVEVGRGLFASTLTTAVVFLPMVFLDGEFKMIVKEPTLALVFPLLVSLLVALTLVPVLVRLALVSGSKGALAKDGISNTLNGGYATLLKWAIRHRGLVIFFIAISLVFTYLEAGKRVRETASSQQANGEYFEVFFQTARGSSLGEVNRSAVVMEKRLAEHPNIMRFGVSFNEDGGSLQVRLLPRNERKNRESWGEIRSTMVEFIGPVPGAELSLNRFDQPLADPQIDFGTEGSLDLKGLDADIINAYAERLIEALRTHPDITNAQLKEEKTDPLMIAALDRDKTGVFDVKAQQLAQYVGATRSSGTISQLQLDDGEKRTNVAFIIQDVADGTVADVKAMQLFTPDAGVVPLGEITRFQNSRTQTSIRRIDRQASAQLSYFYGKGTNASTLSEDVKSIIAGVPNPGGVLVEFDGEAKKIDERQANFFFMIFAGSVLVYVVMAAVFESFWVPLVILATNPLMLIGIVWGLDISGLPLDDLAAFGIILLIGVAVNNGIVMLDRTLSLQRGGLSRTRAVFSASVTRLRPILMTYLTTVIGLLPMALVGEEGSQWRPVAVVIISGLTSATLLTLLVLPCFYLIGDDFVEWVRAPFLRTLALSVEFAEAVVNVVFHPVRLWRRELPFVPTLLPILIGIAIVIWGAVRLPLIVLVGLPGDLRYLIGKVFGRGGGITTEPLAIARPLEPNAGVITTTNLQVFYPPTGLRAVRGRLPHRLGGRPEAGVHALAGVELHLKTGLFGLLGPNGAGKSTLLRCIAGLQEPTRGTVRIFGVAHREAPGALAPLIGYLPQTLGHDERLSLYGYLDYYATLTAITIRRARALARPGEELGARLAGLTALDNPATRHLAVMRAIEEVNLLESTHMLLATFSGGMKQRASIARILLQAPPILIVDEPTAGLDPVERVKVRLLLARLAEHRLVIFSTHLVEDLEHTCNHLAVMNDGRLIFQGTPEDLRGEFRGRLWDVLPGADESEDALRARLAGVPGKQLYRVVREGRQGFRWLDLPVSGITGSRAVEATLDDALTALLGVVKKG